MADNENKKDNKILSMLLIILICILVIYGGYFICKNLALNQTNFGKIDTSRILSMGGDFNY